MKREINGIWKIVIILGGVLITVGALCATIRNNEKRINIIETKAQSNEKDIVELKTDIKYIRKSVDEIKMELKNE